MFNIVNSNMVDKSNWVCGKSKKMTDCNLSTQLTLRTIYWVILPAHAWWPLITGQSKQEMVSSVSPTTRLSASTKENGGVGCGCLLEHLFSGAICFYVEFLYFSRLPVLDLLFLNVYSMEISSLKDISHILCCIVFLEKLTGRRRVCPLSFFFSSSF